MTYPVNLRRANRSHRAHINHTVGEWITIALGSAVAIGCVIVGLQIHTHHHAAPPAVTQHAGVQWPAWDQAHSAYSFAYGCDVATGVCGYTP